MDVAVKTLFLGLSPNVTVGAYPKIQFAVSAVAADAKTSVEDIEVSSSPSQDFSVTASGTSEANELRLSVEVSGAKTEAIFDDVLSKMVAAAQPIPGFRRVKGGEIREITTSDFS
ncbi:hypothetical protein C3L33_22677, partial [Rhododendron williamsianum]